MRGPLYDIDSKYSRTSPCPKVRLTINQKPSKPHFQHSFIAQCRYGPHAKLRSVSPAAAGTAPSHLGLRAAGPAHLAHQRHSRADVELAGLRVHAAHDDAAHAAERLTRSPRRRADALSPLCGPASPEIQRPPSKHTALHCRQHY